MADNQTEKQKVQELTDKLERGLTELFNSDSYKNYLSTMSKFHNYSFNNTLLIAMQKPEASLVAGYKAWQKNFDRHVNKGEKAIRILAPAPYKIKEERDKIDPVTQEIMLDRDGNPQKEEVEITIPAFRAVSVFDVSQTDGKPIPQLEAKELLSDVEGYQDMIHSDYNKEPYQNYLARNLSPSINFKFEETEISGKRVVVLIIPAAAEIPTAFKEKRFLRIGSSKCNIKDYPKREIELFKILDGRTETIETVPAKYQELTFQKLFGYYGSKGIVLNQKTFIKNLRLKTEEGEFNMLAQLLSDNSHFPLRVSIFDGETKGSNLFSVREFGNDCLLYSLDELLRYGDVLNLIQADETDRVVERKEIPLFDNKAFREAIINAVLHNKWVEGNEPMISVFSDRIEILSRGTLAPAQTMEGFFLGESIPVKEQMHHKK